ncbi:MAG: ABC transporter [Omnitrophica WOR_2 bacterium RIFCSPHIGHO2_01_FULL_48_9]|uniref:ABC transporter n=1 Tax=Candidatus Sungbacteria bacterium RIFCSPHIGHO2_02_FULL_47_11 TaxID=1802270 RepID=A0A1G2KIF5_9BACT|nr:MAG: ABC transporter [Omnitrophica WOR_2 bacterium RIFCSPHIGHO2_01_FULL_48_9]OGZ98148.1 MAG: ABC transporter [Candidatus Sungbacteria bacterium RIFCSPHIGHO2_02_FULL_47_11]
MPAITIHNLTKIYRNGVKALKSVSLDVAAGDFFALLGANGAGKTTLINILTGLVNKTSGRVKIFGYDIDTDAAKAKKFIGVVPQEFNFNMFEKVEDIVVTQAGYFGIERNIALPETEKLLKKVGLWEKRNAPSRTLSGGMKRRLMIARALVHQPKLLILDEPTAGVDVELRHGMWEYLRELNRQGTTILLTTHYLEEVEQMCRDAAIIKNGEIVRNDKVKNLVQLLDKETFVVTVKEKSALARLQGFRPVVVDDNTLEFELNKDQTLNDLMEQFIKSGVVVTDIRPQGHRLEKLFLNILRQ